MMMIEIILLICFALLVIGIIAAIVVYGFWFRKKITAVMTDFSRQYGFETELPANPVFGYPSAHGLYKDLPVRIYTIQSKSFDMHDLFTMIDMDTDRNTGFEFSIKARNIVFKLDAFMQSKAEMKTGDESFDQKIMIHSNRKDWLISLLTDELKKIILDGSAKFPYFNLTFDGATLNAKRQGTFIADNVRASIEYLLPMFPEVIRQIRLIPSASLKANQVLE